MSSRPSKRPSYTSSYQPRDEPLITYNSYSFIRFSFEVDVAGNVAIVCGPDPDANELLVANDWKKHYDIDDFGTGGYIGKGWSKVAIKVSHLLV